MFIDEKIKKKEEFSLYLHYYLRKSVPKSQVFYFIMVLVKFLPSLILVSSISENESSNITLRYLLSYVIIGDNMISSINFTVLYIFIYIFLFGSIILFILVKISVNSLSKTSSELLNKNIRNLIKFPIQIKRMIKIFTVIYIFIFFFSQHISEVLFYGIFKFFTHNKPESYFNKTYYNNYVTFKNNLKIDNTLLLILNIICIILIMIFTYLFFRLYRFRNLVDSFGFNWNINKFGTGILVIISNFQGIASILNYLNDEHSKYLKFCFCFIMFILNLVFILNLIFTNCLIHFYMYPIICICNYCYSSALIEILSYYFDNRKKLDQATSFTKMIFILLDSFILTIWINKYKKKKIINLIANEGYSMVKKREEDITSGLFLIECYINLLLKDLNSLNNYDILSDIYEKHKLNCKDPDCICNSFNNNVNCSYKENINNFMVYACENSIYHYIKEIETNLQNKKKILFNFYLLQIIFEFFIKENYNKALYLLQLLTQNRTKISFYDLYHIFEIRKIIDKRYRTKTVITNKKKLIACENFFKIEKIITEEKFKNKIINLFSKMSYILNDIIFFRQKYNSKNTKILISDELIKILLEFLQHLDMLKYCLVIYFNEKRRNPNEIRFLLKEFIKIAPNGTKLFKDFLVDNKYKFERKNIKLMLNEKDSFMVNELRLKDSLKIKYISMKILNILEYSQREILEKDISEIIPSCFGSLHNEIIKNFIINSHPDFSFSFPSFLCSKQNNLINTYQVSKIYPSFENPLMLISKITIVYHNKGKKECLLYEGFLDKNLKFLTLSREFSRDFFLNYNALNAVNISFPVLFGINPEKLYKVFDHKVIEKSAVNLFKSNNKKDNKKNSLNNKEPNENKIKIIKELLKNSGTAGTKLFSISRNKMILAIKYIISHMDEKGKELGYMTSFENLLRKITLDPNDINSPYSKVYDKYKVERKSIINNHLPENMLFSIKITKKIMMNDYYFFIIIKGHKNFYNKSFNINKTPSFCTFGSNEIKENNEENAIVNSYNLKDNRQSLNKAGKSILNLKNYNSKSNFNYILSNMKKEESNIMSSNCGNSFTGSKFYNANISNSNAYNNTFNFNNNVSNVSYSEMQNNNQMFFVNNKNSYGDISYMKNINNDQTKNNISQNDITMLQNSQINFLKSTNKLDNIPEFSAKIIKRINNNSQENNFDAISKTLLINEKYKELLKYTYLLRVIQLLFYLVLFCLLVVIFVKNKQSLDNSLNLFKMNSSLFLIMFDLFTNCIICVRESLIKERYQEGELLEMRDKKRLLTNSLLENYHICLGVLNDMGSSGKEIYEMFNEKKEHSYLMKDWSSRPVYSSLIDEMDYICYLFNSFDLISKGKECRIKKLFFESDERKFYIPGEEPNLNEQLLFYIIYNINSVYSLTFDSITLKSTTELSSYMKTSEITSILLIIFIIIVAFIVYLDVILTINLNRNIFLEYLKCFLHKTDDQEEKQNIYNYIELLNDFYYQNVTKYFKRLCKLEGSIVSVKSSVLDDTKILSKTHRHPSSKKKDLTKKKQDHKQKDEKEDLEKIESLNNQRKKFIKEPVVSKVAIVGVVILFVIFTVIQIVNLLVNFQFNSNLSFQNITFISFYSRIPRMTELCLYAMISVLNNNPNFISRNEEDYNSKDFNSFFQPEIAYDKNSLYDILGRTNYYYLYYKVLIYRKKIENFSADRSTKVLQGTKVLANSIREGSDFCSTISKLYADYVENYYDDTKDGFENLVENFKLINSKTEECYNLGNGINSAGNKRAFDVHINQLNTLYLDYFNSSRTISDAIKFISSKNLADFIDNFTGPIRTLHVILDIYMIEDVQNTLKNKYRSDVIFSVISIIFSLCLIFVIVFLVIGKIENYTKIIKESTNDFNL